MKTKILTFVNNIIFLLKSRKSSSLSRKEQSQSVETVLSLKLKSSPLFYLKIDPRISIKQANQSGLALLMVVFIVALASVIMVNLFYNTNLAARLNSMSARSVQAEYLLKSTLNIARRLIQEDTSPEDAPDDPWGYFMNGAKLPAQLLGLNTQNVSIELEIRPEDARIRLDQLAQPANAQRWGWVLFRLFKELGFDEDGEADQSGVFPDKSLNSRELVGVLIDYIDPDSDSYPSTDFAVGVEGEVNKEGIFANERITTVEELKSLPGFTAARIAKLTPYVTTRGKLRININAAPIEILKALDDQIDDGIAQKIIDRRNEKPFSRPGWTTDLAEIVGQDVYNHISTMVDVESSWFQVLAKVDYGGNSRYFLRAVVYEEEGVKNELPIISSLELF